MSTPDQAPQLTRRQLRELRNTASTPIITAEDAAAALAAQQAAVAAEEAAGEAPGDEPSADEIAPEAEDVDEVEDVDEAETDAGEDTAEPVDEVADEEEAADETVADEEPADEDVADEEPADEDVADEEPVDEDVADEEPVVEDVADEEPVAEESAGEAVEDEGVAEDDVSEEPADVEAVEDAAVVEAAVDEAPVDEAPGEPEPDAPALTRRVKRQQERLRTASLPVVAEAEVASTGDDEAETASTGDDDVETASTGDATEAATELPAVAAYDEEFHGTPALTFPPAVALDVAQPIDQEFERSLSSTGSLSVPNALILSQSPETGSFVAPVTSTGEILVTGSFSLPDTYGSTGTLPGAADGKEIDSTLIDGELPAASSPSPIAASSAISTIKSAEDVIKPPVPEKSGRLMMVLAVTAGVLALALAGVLILAFTTGVLQ